MYLVQGVYLVLGGVPGQVLPPVDRMTHAYENITLPQTSFAGGNNLSHPHFIGDDVTPSTANQHKV